MSAAPEVLLAGLPAGIRARLRELLPGAAVENADSLQALAEALPLREWRLLVVDSALEGLESPASLRQALASHGDPAPSVIFCARSPLDANLAHELVEQVGVDHLLYHPLDEHELARVATPILELPPAAPRERRAREEALSSAVTGVWERFRGAIFARIAVLEDAAIALLEGNLEYELRHRATREAHKLAGALGTFGFPAGSLIARGIEALLEGEAPLSHAEALALSQRVVNLRAEVDRTPPQSGSTPAPAVAEKAPRLLIVDDDQELAERLSLEAAGRQMRPEVAHQIGDARRAVLRDRPDVVLLDLCFEDEGQEALEFLRDLSSNSPPIPTVVLTVRDSLIDRVEVARRGGQGFLQKPLPPPKVIDALTETLRYADVSQGTVLAVDDDPVVLETLRATLEPHGFTVVTLDNPLRFWQLLDETCPDLLILDLEMPHVTGIELCRVVRNDPRWAAVPVLFLAAHGTREEVHRIFAAGADDYMPKPLVANELVTRIANRRERVHVHHLVAQRDPLTDLPHRARAEEVLSHFLLLAAREERPFLLAVVQLDDFDAVQERQGRTVGDEVLQRIARIFVRFFRAEDVVARWRDDEFVIGMYGMEKPDAVARLTALLAQVRDQEFTASDEEPVRLTFSAGLSEFPRDGVEPRDLYRAAEEALYQAKRDGGARVLAAGWSGAETSAVQIVDVLLVDDDPVLAGLLLHALENRGYRTHWIQDGQSAVEALVGAQPLLRARVILLDVDLPGLNGLGVLRALAEDHVLLRSRVVMLTARAGEQEVLKALDLGATDHVAKPFSVPVLLQRVRRALGRSRTP